METLFRPRRQCLKEEDLFCRSRNSRHYRADYYPANDPATDISNSHTLTYSITLCPNAFQQLSEATTMPCQPPNTCHTTCRFRYVLDVNRLLIPNQFDEIQVAVLQWLVTSPISVFCGGVLKTQNGKSVF